ncbi:kinesin-like protein KIN-7K, chloroplastic [Tanacetum coccineum]
MLLLLFALGLSGETDNVKQIRLVASVCKGDEYIYYDTYSNEVRKYLCVVVTDCSNMKETAVVNGNKIPREIRRGEDIAWYADGETILRNEETPSIAYAYDRVFGPTTTTRQVYDIAAQHVVSGAMEGVNGTIFAYGVTSSGKTHTMHGDQRSPGIIPLAVKDAFSIIQETPNREFLLRVSYLEIYNEVVNDLLNPAGQNLRIREDSQRAFVEGIKEEVVLSPAHVLSLIAAGEEHRHVGSTNFNLLSSRSHTIFTLTIESSPCGESGEGEAVNFSQLNLIDLAGSESSKAETTGVRQKEGSLINKSLLTLGTFPVTNSSQASGFLSHCPKEKDILWRRELAYLPQRRRDLSLEDENTELYVSLDGSAETNNDVLKEEKKIKRPGLLNWLKLRKRESVSGALTSTSDKSSGAKSISPLSTPSAGNRNPVIEHSHPLPTECTSSEYLSDSKQDQQNNEDNFSPQDTPLTSIKTIDQIDLLREQQRVLSGEVAIHLSTLEQLSDETARDTKKEFLNVEITRLHDEIERNNEQISLLEGHISDSDTSSRHKMDEVEQSRSFLELEAQLNEKSFELEVRTADNRVIQEQLDLKINECEGLRETIASLKQQLSDAHDSRNPHIEKEFAKREDTKEDLLRQAQAYEIEELRQKVTELTESKEKLEARNRKLANDSSYAKGLASAAAVELKALSEEVAKLMNQNEKLTAELATPKYSPTQRKATVPTKNGRITRPKEQSPTQMELKRELALRKEREISYETLISEKNQREMELERRIEESKQREAYLENELANMWVMVAKLKRSQGDETDPSESSKDSQRVDGWDLI